MNDGEKEGASTSRRMPTESNYKSRDGGFLNHRIARIESKKGTQIHYTQILDMIKKSPVTIKNQETKIQHKKTLSSDQTPTIQPASKEKEPTTPIKYTLPTESNDNANTPPKEISKSFRPTIKIHKRSNSNIESETSPITNIKQSAYLPSIDEFTPGRNITKAFNLGESRKSEVTIRSRHNSKGGETERPSNYSLQQSRPDLILGVDDAISKSFMDKAITALKHKPNLLQSQLTSASLAKSVNVTSINSLSRGPSYDGGSAKLPPLVKSTSKSFDYYPGYFMDALKKVIIQKNVTTARDKIYFEQYIKNIKDLTSMATDELLDEEEYLDKIKMRKHLKEVESAFPEVPFEKPLLVLDMDETLVHCLKDNHKEGWSEIIYLAPNKQPISLRYNIRPFAREFLEEMSNLFEIYVFTASEIGYARTLIQTIDPNREFVKKIFDRRFCCVTQKGYVVKDLRIFTRESRLKKIFLVDNSSYCFFPQQKNGIPIIPFENNKADRELLELKEYLKYLLNEKEPVEFNANYFKLDKYSKGGRMDELAFSLF